MNPNPDNSQDAHNHICPVSAVGSFDNMFRGLFHNPSRMFGQYVESGSTAVDLGAGGGVFSMALARMVGKAGRVYAVDIQQGMLDLVEKRAIKEGLRERITLHLASSEGIGLQAEVAEFALASWMVHEVPEQEKFFREVYDLMKPGGHFLIIEPKIHVSQKGFDAAVALATGSGFVSLGKKRVALSFAELLQKPMA